jgi:predicted SprT family Zn-dependent metalloprotease
VQDVIERLCDQYCVTNREKFDGALPERYHIAFNPHLRRLTGRITYGLELIEISLYHFRQYGFADAVQTLEHEMLHLFLHTLGRPSGHNTLFKELAHALGIRVFHSNPYPRNQPSRHRHLYECPSCRRMVFRRRLHRHKLACGVCCRREADGVWDERFALQLVSTVKFG